ncbi:hypothetical protein CDL15_Pgr004449 [Punica granatum]|uniref:Uncharacterized protein n=1 Tax=Punica granatum TaxID=22663 RepID=A0A218XGU7_PUNGR|nr:hypothetical protein CDL15_Pgr004449 [Punica granatum]
MQLQSDGGENINDGQVRVMAFRFVSTDTANDVWKMEVPHILLKEWAGGISGGNPDFSFRYLNDQSSSSSSFPPLRGFDFQLGDSQSDDRCSTHEVVKSQCKTEEVEPGKFIRKCERTDEIFRSYIGK